MHSKLLLTQLLLDDRINQELLGQFNAPDAVLQSADHDATKHSNTGKES
jgi:hypothetical protein